MSHASYDVVPPPPAHSFHKILQLSASLFSVHLPSQSRFLPDKAIDLVDEACSNVRVALDSKPEAIDGLERQRQRLLVEEAALKKEKDPISVARLEEVKKELVTLEDSLRPLQVWGV